MHEEFLIMLGEPENGIMTLTHDFASAHGPHEVFTEIFEYFAEH